MEYKYNTKGTCSSKIEFEVENEIVKNSDIFVIIRTSWLYSVYGNNFVKTMRRLGAEKESINVVSDQIGTPTYAGDLADAIVQIIPQMTRENSGVYHFTNMGVCSWYDFASEIMEMSGLKCAVNPIKSSEYPTRAVPFPVYVPHIYCLVLPYLLYKDLLRQFRCKPDPS